MSMKRTSRIWSGASTNSSVENLTSFSAAGGCITFAKSKRLFRESKWLGLRMSLHSRYWTSWYGRPSAYLPGLRSGIRLALVSSGFPFTGSVLGGFLPTCFAMVLLRIAGTASQNTVSRTLESWELLGTYAAEARRAYEEQPRAAPNDAQRHVFLGLALAYLGRKDGAIREGERGVALAHVPYKQHQRLLGSCRGRRRKAIGRKGSIALKPALSQEIRAWVRRSVRCSRPRRRQSAPRRIIRSGVHPMTLLAGTRLGPYEILAALSAGGMGEVYRARDKRTRYRHVARRQRRA